MRFSLILVVLLISFSGFAQEDWNTFPKSDTISKDTIGAEGILTDSLVDDTIQPKINIAPGTVNITVSQGIIDCDEKLKEAAKNDPKINGFTIVIYSRSGANSRNNAHTIQNEFKSQFPDMVNYLTWKSPNYEVRVGDFRTKMDAERELQQLKEAYSSAVIKPSKIELPALDFRESELED